ncbi:hypothetical protein ABEB36_010479 [Hypothenemus hampei]|uniref:Replication protein A subunit n=1 Tax=Hypothenemus hampei TaxID=57062 RepID=A0ABD1EK01_HYPHA
MAELLTRGALATIMSGGEYTEPVVQVLSIKKMNAGSGQPEKDRYRAYLSDGECAISFAIMTAPVYAKAGENGLSKFTIMKIGRYITSVVNNTEGKDSRVLLILDLQILKNGDDIGEKIGNPTPYSETIAKKTPSPSAGPHPPAKTPKVMNSGSGAGTSTAVGNLSISPHLTHPISSLTPYHNKWIIKARVINKSDIRKWENARGAGQLFSMDLADESGEIRCTAFREMVDKYFPLIEIDKVYYISKCQVKTANKQFNSLKNDYEMTMTSETIVEECLDDDMSSLQTHYNFISINKIAEMEANETIDVIGVVTSVGDLQTFQARTTGRELKKKEVQLVDQSNTTITLTLWGQQAENFNGSGNPVVVVKGARISEFGGGKTLSAMAGTLMKINPEIKECYRIKGWYESEGMHSTTKDISMRTGIGGFSTPWMSFTEVTEQQLGTINPSKGDYYQVKGTVLLVKHENALYKACPSPDCNKKVIDNDDGTYRCEKCQKIFEYFKYRFLCNMNVGDWSGNQWISTFNDEAEKVVGMSAQEAGAIQENDSRAFSEKIEECHFKEFIFKCRAKMESYNDEQRLKTVAIQINPINYEDYNSHLINNIKQYIN